LKWAAKQTQRLAQGMFNSNGFHDFHKWACGFRKRGRKGRMKTIRCKVKALERACFSSTGLLGGEIKARPTEF